MNVVRKVRLARFMLVDTACTMVCSSSKAFFAEPIFSRAIAFLSVTIAAMLCYRNLPANSLLANTVDPEHVPYRFDATNERVGFTLHCQ